MFGFVFCSHHNQLCLILLSFSYFRAPLSLQEWFVVLGVQDAASPSFIFIFLSKAKAAESSLFTNEIA